MIEMEIGILIGIVLMACLSIQKQIVMRNKKLDDLIYNMEIWSRRA